MKTVKSCRIEIVTYGPNKLFDITDRVRKIVEGVEEGVVVLQAVGSTGALVILPQRKEVIEAFENDLWDLVPTLGWKHPGNAYAHLRSTLVGTVLSIPIIMGTLPLDGSGIFFLENQPALNRRRVIIATVLTRS